MLPYLILAALVFAACYAVDKGFSRLFRNSKQHKFKIPFHLCYYLKLFINAF